MLSLIGLGTIALALYDLLLGLAWVASSIWLAFVAWLIGGSIKEFGFARFLTNVLGEFSLDHWVQIVPKENEARDAHFGFRFFGQRRVYLAIPLSRIESVEWSSGQGTQMAGRDMNDWHVAVWYDHLDPIRSRKQAGWRKADQEVYILGPSRSKDITGDFAHAFLRFLGEAGVSLFAGKDEKTFVRADRS